MKKIKTYLIHLLGGVTKREAFCAHVNDTLKLAHDVTERTLPLGSLIAARHLKHYADSLNGIPADEWCKRMYDAISSDVERYDKQLDEANYKGLFGKAKKHEEHENNEPQQTETTDTAHSETDK